MRTTWLQKSCDRARLRRAKYSNRTIARQSNYDANAQKNHCDYLVGSTHVIDLTLMKTHEKGIAKTKVRLAEKPFFFALPQNKVDTIKEVKMHLEELKRTGELDRIVANYRGS